MSRFGEMYLEKLSYNLKKLKSRTKRTLTD